MLKVLLFIITFISHLYAVTSPSFKAIEPWERQMIQEHIGQLQKKYGKLSTQEIKQSHHRAQKAAKEKNYLLEIAELERLIGHSPTNLEALFDICLARVRAIAAGTEDNWQHQRNLKWEALQALQQAKSPEDEARALLFYVASNHVDEAERNAVLMKVSLLMPLSQLRKKFPELRDVLPFKYTGFHFDDRKTTPTACLTFSQPVADNLQGKDFVELSPTADIAVTHRGQEVCVKGLAHGKNYAITVKPGLKSQFDEVTAEPAKVDVYVPDNEPRISFANHKFILQKGEQNLLPVSTVNLDRFKLRVIRLSDRTLTNIRQFFLDAHFYGTLEDESREIYKGTYEVMPAADEAKSRNQTVVTNIDLNAVLKDIQPGLYVVTAIPEGFALKNASEARQWLLVTDMGLTTYKGGKGLDVDVRSLTSAQALEGITVELISRGNEILGQTTTEKSGLAHFPGPMLQGTKGNEPLLVLAYTAKKDDFSLIFLNEPAFDLTDRGVNGRTVPGPMDAYVYTDRGVYRGGETVHVNAIVRNQENKAVPELPLILKLTRPDGVVTAHQVLKGTAQGRYEIALPLLEKSRTGLWTLTLHTDEEKAPIGNATFQIEDFVPARLLVRLKASEGAIVGSQPLDVEVSAQYLFGAMAANLSGAAFVRLIKHPNPFPKLQAFSFGLTEEDFIEKRTDINFEGLDGKGQGAVKANLEPDIKTTHPLQFQVNVNVVTPGGKQQFGSIRRLALPQPHMIGIRPTFESALGFDDTEATFEVVSVDGEGNLQADADLEYELIAEEVHYSWYKTARYGAAWEYRPIVEDQSLKKDKINTKDDVPIRLTVPVKDWGGHRLTITNPKTGAATSLRFAKGYASTTSTHTPHRLSIVADKEKYKVGETVKLHITAPFDGIARLVVANQNVSETYSVPIQNKKADMTLQASEHWNQGTYVVVTAYRPLDKKPGAAALLPKRAVGLTWIGMDTTDRTLKVVFETLYEIRPNQQLTIPVTVKGTKFKDVQMTIAAVDEGILQLTEFKSPAPEDYFFAKTMLGVELRDIYGRIIDPQEGRTGVLRSGGDIDALSRNLAALSKRSFKIVSLYQGKVELDAEGKGQVTLAIPEFNGKLRLMAVAFDADHVGSGTGEVLVRDPVVIEPALPRFLNRTDQVTVPIVLHNVALEKGELKVKVEFSGALSLKDPALANQTVTLEKDAQKILTFPCVANQAGDAKVVVHLEGPNDLKLSQTQEVSVTHENISDTQSEMHLVKPGEAYTVLPDRFKAFYPETVKADLALYAGVPWNQQAFLKELARYPYGCVEQLTSRGFGDLVSDSQDNLIRILKYLGEQQRSDGTFSLWLGNTTQNDWLTAYTFHLMQSAKIANVPQSGTTYQSTLDALPRLVRLDSKPKPAELFTAAYALYLLSREDKIQPGEVRYFFDIFYAQLPNRFAKAFIIATLARIGDEERLAQALEKLEVASPDNSLFYGSEIRNEAGFLALLLEAAKSQPSFAALQKPVASAVESLANRVRTAGRLSTDEQAWLVLAGQQLLAQLNADKVFQFLLNDKETSARKLHLISFTAEQRQQPVQIKNTSADPLWLGVHITATPKEALPAVSNGLTLKRTFHNLKGEIVDSKALKSGQSYVVIIEGTLTEAHTEANLLIVDRLAAGLEIDNPGLNPANIEAKSALSWLENLSLLSHRELRDDRFVAALSPAADQKTFKIAYGVRATLPGTYVLPPLTGEDMFAPQHHARTAAETVVVG